MLAYCTAANLPSGLLAYAAGKTEPGVHRIGHADKAIEVVSLDISGPPETILAGVCRITLRVRSLAARAWKLGRKPLDAKRDLGSRTNAVNVPMLPGRA